MSLYKNYATDVSKEVNGVAVELGKNEDGTTESIVISRAGESNKQYARALEHAQKPYRRQIQLGTMDKDTNEKLYMEVFASYIIKGWSNIRDENGVDMPFNKTNAIKLLTDLPELYNELFRQATSLELFRAEILEADAKN